ncbi:3'-5' exonuclease [Candidatus Woesearchaeota archaeon]|nr:3'-5' exonuclease [Candidatus Woesearchaeota archaeon]
MVYTVVDIETTGLSRHYHRITEIAAAHVSGNRVVERYHTLVNPCVRIPVFITKLTGISDGMVRDAPKIEEVLPDFLGFLGNRVFVAHNATFDFRFLEHNALVHLDQELSNRRLCTRKLANRLCPELARKRLCDLCEHFNVKNEQSHRAMGDVDATVKVFSCMLKTLEKMGISDIDEIFKFEKSLVRR